MPEARYFLCRLIPPRPDFATTLTSDEGEIMQAHARYLTNQLQLGKAIAFGPVADPRGDWGVVIVSAPDQSAVEAMRDADPAILSERGFHYEILPMLGLIARA